MHDFEDEQDPLQRNGAEPLAGSGLEGEKEDADFISLTEEPKEGREQ